MIYLTNDLPQNYPEPTVTGRDVTSDSEASFSVISAAEGLGRSEAAFECLAELAYSLKRQLATSADQSTREWLFRFFPDACAEGNQGSSGAVQAALGGPPKSPVVL